MRIIILLCLSLVAFFSNAQLVPEKLLSAKVFQQQIAKSIDAVIIDVRKPEEFKGGSMHLKHILFIACQEQEVI